MPKAQVLTDSDIELLQEWTRCNNELVYARGENKISLVVYEMDLKDKLEQRGLLCMIA